MEESLVIKQDLTLTKFDNFSNLSEMKNFAEELIKSNLIPFKTSEQAIAVALMGKDLGIGFSTSMNNIYNIQSKPALSVWLMMALVKNIGVDWQVEKDFEKITNAEGKVVDYITQVRFFRFNKVLNRTMENVITYCWNDAVKAEYTTKVNWKTKPKEMLMSRCLTRGAKIVAPDALMGIPYEVTELLDSMTDYNYVTNDEGSVTIIKDKNGKEINFLKK